MKPWMKAIYGDVEPANSPEDTDVPTPRKPVSSKMKPWMKAIYGDVEPANPPAKSTNGEQSKGKSFEQQFAEEHPFLSAFTDWTPIGHVSKELAKVLHYLDTGDDAPLNEGSPVLPFIGGTIAETIEKGFNPEGTLAAKYDPSVAAISKAISEKAGEFADKALDVGSKRLTVDDYDTFIGALMNSTGSGHYGSMGGFTRFLGLDKSADAYDKAAAALYNQNRVSTDAGLLEYFTNTRGLASDFGQLLGSQLTIMPFGFTPTGAAGKLLGGIAAKAGGSALVNYLVKNNWNRSAKFLANQVPELAAYGAKSGAAESMMEGGGVLKEALDAGYSPEEARALANEAALYNLPLLMGTNTLEAMGMFSPLGKFSKLGRLSKPAQIAGRMAMNSGQEQFEEAMQRGIEDAVMGREYGVFPWNWTKEQWEAADAVRYPAAITAGVGSAFQAIRGKDDEGNWIEGDTSNVTPEGYRQRAEHAAAKQSYEKLREYANQKTGKTMSNDVFNAIVRESNAQGVDPRLALSIAIAESQGDQGATSPVGAIGVMQLMPETAQALGVDPHDMEQNVRGGVKYLKQMLDTFNGNTTLAIAAYNAGPNAVKRYGDIPPYAETQKYVGEVNGYLKDVADIQADMPYVPGTGRGRNLPSQGVVYLGENGGGEGKYWERNISMNPSLKGAQPDLPNALDILAKWYYDRTGKKLLLNAGTNGDHAVGTYSHGNGYKIDVIDEYVAGEDSPLITAGFQKGKLADEFIAFGRSLGLGMNFEGAGTNNVHFDISLAGEQWDGNGENAGGFSLNRVRAAAKGGRGWSYSSPEQGEPDNSSGRTTRRTSPSQGTPEEPLVTDDEEESKPLFDLNAEDDDTKNVIGRFAEERRDAAEGTDEFDFFDGMFDRGGNFRNTKENRDAIRERFPEELTDFGNSWFSQQQQEPPQPQPTPKPKATPPAQPIEVPHTQATQGQQQTQSPPQPVTPNQTTTTAQPGQPVATPQTQPSQGQTQSQPSQDPVSQNTTPENVLPSTQGQEQKQSQPATPQTQTTAQPATPPKKIGGVQGNAAQVMADNRNSYGVQYKVVEADDLNVSHGMDARGGGAIYENPNYPRELQPRDRTREGYRDNVVQMANRLDPTQLMDSNNVNQGAPVIRSDGVVLNGNGRSMAIRRAYDQAPERATAYRNALIENAEHLGLNKDEIAQMKKPVLVREMAQNLSGEDLNSITQSRMGGMQLGATELALSDAEKIPADILNRAPKDGDLTKEGARQFLIDVLNAITTPEERNAVTSADGGITDDGLRRVRNAIFAAAYGESTTLTKIAETSQTEGDTVRGATNGLVSAAAKFALIRSRMKDGTLPQVDLKPIIRAVEKLKGLRDSGESVFRYLNATSLFGTSNEDEDMKDILGFIEGHKRRPADIAQFLHSIADRILNSTSNSGSLFGEQTQNRKLSLKDIIAKARQSIEGEDVTRDMLRRKPIFDQVAARLHRTLGTRNNSGAQATVNRLLNEAKNGNDNALQIINRLKGLGGSQSANLFENTQEDGTNETTPTPAPQSTQSTQENSVQNTEPQQTQESSEVKRYPEGSIGYKLHKKLKTKTHPHLRVWADALLERAKNGDEEAKERIDGILKRDYTDEQLDAWEQSLAQQESAQNESQPESNLPQTFTESSSKEPVQSEPNLPQTFAGNSPASESTPENSEMAETTSAEESQEQPTQRHRTPEQKSPPTPRETFDEESADTRSTQENSDDVEDERETPPDIPPQSQGEPEQLQRSVKPPNPKRARILGAKRFKGLGKRYPEGTIGYKLHRKLNPDKYPYLLQYVDDLLEQAKTDEDARTKLRSILSAPDEVLAEMEQNFAPQDETQPETQSEPEESTPVNETTEGEEQEISDKDKAKRRWAKGRTGKIKRYSHGSKGFALHKKLQTETHPALREYADDLLERAAVGDEQAREEVNSILSRDYSDEQLEVWERSLNIQEPETQPESRTETAPEEREQSEEDNKVINTTPDNINADEELEAKLQAKFPAIKEAISVLIKVANNLSSDAVAQTKARESLVLLLRAAQFNESLANATPENQRLWATNELKYLWENLNGKSKTEETARIEAEVKSIIKQFTSKTLSAEELYQKAGGLLFPEVFSKTEPANTKPESQTKTSEEQPTSQPETPLQKSGKATESQTAKEPETREETSKPEDESQEETPKQQPQAEEERQPKKNKSSKEEKQPATSVIPKTEEDVEAFYERNKEQLDKKTQTLTQNVLMNLRRGMITVEEAFKKIVSPKFFDNFFTRKDNIVSLIRNPLEGTVSLKALLDELRNISEDFNGAAMGQGFEFGYNVEEDDDGNIKKKSSQEKKEEADQNAEDFLTEATQYLSDIATGKEPLPQEKPKEKSKEKSKEKPKEEKIESPYFVVVEKDGKYFVALKNKPFLSRVPQNTLTTKLDALALKQEGTSTTTISREGGARNGTAHTLKNGKRAYSFDSKQALNGFLFDATSRYLEPIEKGKLTLSEPSKAKTQTQTQTKAPSLEEIKECFTIAQVGNSWTVKVKGNPVQGILTLNRVRNLLEETPPYYTSVRSEKNATTFYFDDATEDPEDSEDSYTLEDAKADAEQFLENAVTELHNQSKVALINRDAEQDYKDDDESETTEIKQIDAQVETLLNAEIEAENAKAQAQAKAEQERKAAQAKAEQERISKENKIKAKRIEVIKDFNELEEYFRVKHNATIDPEVKNLDFEGVKELLTGIEKVFDEFSPQFAGRIHRITTSTRLSDRTYTKFSFGKDNRQTTVNFVLNGNWMSRARIAQTREKLQKEYISGEFSTATLIGTGAHEAGHAITLLLANRLGIHLSSRIALNSFSLPLIKWACSLSSDATIKSAAAKATELNALKQDISNYSKTNKECIAEAVGNAIEFGENSKPFAKAIFNALKQASTEVISGSAKKGSFFHYLILSRNFGTRDNKDKLPDWLQGQCSTQLVWEWLKARKHRIADATKNRARIQATPEQLENLKHDLMLEACGVATLMLRDANLVAQLKPIGRDMIQALKNRNYADQKVSQDIFENTLKSRLPDPKIMAEPRWTREKIREAAKIGYIFNALAQNGYADGIKVVLKTEEDVARCTNIIRGFEDSDFNLSADESEGTVDTTIRETPRLSELSPFYRALSEFAEMLGVPVVFFRGDPNFHGTHKRGITFINVDANRSASFIFWHEFGHWLKNNQPDLYKAIANSVEITQEQIDEKRATRLDLMDEEIRDEIIFDAFRNAAQREELFKLIGKKDKNLLERFVSWAKAVLDRFTDWFRKPDRGLTTAQANQMQAAFGKMIRSLTDGKGNKIFRVNNQNHVIEHIDGRALKTTNLDAKAGFSFAGKKAKTADLARLDKAIDMEKQGASKDEIYEVTGFVKGRDGKWRFEIEDDLDKIDFSKLVFKNGNGVATLGEIYDNPALYTAYPELESMNVLALASDDNIGGEYVPLTDSIVLNTKHQGEWKSTLVHEIQHAIQEREEFAKGGTPEQVLEQLVRNKEALKKHIAKLPKGSKDRKLFEDMAKSVQQGISAIIRDPINDPLKAYRRLGGEQEAREVSERAERRQESKTYDFQDEIERSQKYAEESRRKLDGLLAKQSSRVQSLTNEYMDVMEQNDDERAESLRQALPPNVRWAADIAFYAELDAKNWKDDGRSTPIIHSKDAIIALDRYGSSATFAGEKAKTADLKALEKAKEMEANGASRDEIYKATKWFKGKDDKWRFEIPDHRKEINLSVLENGKFIPLPEVYANPALFKAYPFLEKIRVAFKESWFFDDEFGEGGEETYGMIYPDPFGRPPYIFLNSEFPHEELQKGLVHEIQHLIQVAEDFAKGGDPTSVFNAIDDEIKNTQKEIDSLPQGNKRRDELSKHLEKLEGVFRGEYSFSEKELDDLYRRLGGEQEAREVEDRLDNPKGTPRVHTTDALIVYQGEGYPMERRAETSANEKNATEGERREISDGYYTESGRTLRKSSPDEYIVDEDGNPDFAQISEDVAEKSDGAIKPLPVRLQVGVHIFKTQNGSGLKHIVIKHRRDIREHGFGSSLEFINYVLKNFNQVYKHPTKDRRIILFCDDDSSGFMPLELVEKNDHYVIVTAFPRRNTQINGELVYDSREALPTATADGTTEEKEETPFKKTDNKGGDSLVTASGETNSPSKNIAQDAEQSKAKERINATESERELSNTLRDDELTPVQKAIREFCSRIGVPVEFFRGSSRNQGAFKNGTVFINADAKMTPEWIFHHEVGHWLAVNNPQLFNQLVDILNITDEQRDAYRKAKNKPHLTDAEANAEILCDKMGDIAQRLQLFKDVGKADASLAQRLVAWIKAALDKFTDFFFTKEHGLTRSQRDRLYDTFGKITREILDERGNKLFRYNSKTRAIERADGTPLPAVELTEANDRARTYFSTAGKNSKVQAPNSRPPAPPSTQQQARNASKSAQEEISKEAATEETKAERSWLQSLLHKLAKKFGIDYDRIIVGEDERNATRKLKKKAMEEFLEAEEAYRKNRTATNESVLEKKRERLRSLGITREDLNAFRNGEENSDFISPKQYWLSSPGRIAQKIPLFRAFFQLADKALDELIKSRARYARMYQAALNLVPKAEDRKALFALLWLGDKTKTVFGELTKDELDDLNLKAERLVAKKTDAAKREAAQLVHKARVEKICAEQGVSENVAEAYIAIRRILEKMWRDINEARRHPQRVTKWLSDQAIDDLKNNKFVDQSSISINPNRDASGRRAVTYKEYANVERELVVGANGLKRLQNSKDVQILAETTLNRGKKPRYLVRFREGYGALKKETGYIPHFFHEYSVVVRDKRGQIVVVENHHGEKTTTIGTARTELDAVRIANEWLKDHKLKDGENIYVEPRSLSRELGIHESQLGELLGDKNYAKMTTRLMENYSDAFSSSEEAEAKLTQMAEEKNKPYHRSLKNLINRTGAKGFEEDMDWVLRQYMHIGTRYVALESWFKPQAMSTFERIFGAFDDDWSDNDLAQYTKQFILDVNGNPTWLETFLNKIFNHWKPVRTFIAPMFEGRKLITVTDTATRFVAYAKLGFLNVSSAMLNLTQFVNAGAYVGYPTLAKYAAKLLKQRGKLTLGQLRILDESGVLNDLGLDTVSDFDKNQVLDFGGSWLDKLDYLGNKSMILFQSLDSLCRAATTLAAYEEATAAGKTKAQALKHAADINRKANFSYGIEDAPNIFRRSGPLGKVLLQFYKYPIKELELLGDVAPWSNTTTLKQKLKFWGPYFLLCGLMGILPGFDWGDDFLSKHFKIFPKDFVEKAVISACQEIFGADSDAAKTAARTLLYGAGAAVNVNTSSRAGLSDLIPNDFNSFLMGALGSTIWNTARNTVNEDYANALQSFSPGLYNYYAAYTGESTSPRNRKNYIYDTAWKRIVRAVGFKTADETAISDKYRIYFNEKAEWKDERQDAIDAYIAAFEDNDQEEMKELAPRLSELGITRKQVETEIRRKHETRLERLEDDFMTKRQRAEYRRRFGNFAEPE